LSTSRLSFPPWRNHIGKIVEEVATYVAERGRLEKEKYSELYRRFRKQYPLPAQLIQQAINQGVEIGK
jgi:hypothetical protein